MDYIQRRVDTISKLDLTSCHEEYVLPVKISTTLSLEIDGYMTKEEHDSMFG